MRKKSFVPCFARVARACELGVMVWGCGVAHFGCDQLRLPDREKGKLDGDITTSNLLSCLCIFDLLIDGKACIFLSTTDIAAVLKPGWRPLVVTYFPFR